MNEKIADAISIFIKKLDSLDVVVIMLVFFSCVCITLYVWSKLF